VTFTRQLAAAKLNLLATELEFGGASCSGFKSSVFPTLNIYDIISSWEAVCENGYPNVKPSCDNALDEFNNSVDANYDDGAPINVFNGNLVDPGPAKMAEKKNNVIIGNC
jgi:hypothetical protein